MQFRVSSLFFPFDGNTHADPMIATINALHQLIDFFVHKLVYNPPHRPQPRTTFTISRTCYNFQLRNTMDVSALSRLPWPPNYSKDSLLKSLPWRKPPRNVCLLTLRPEHPRKRSLLFNQFCKLQFQIAFLQETHFQTGKVPQLTDRWLHLHIHATNLNSKAKGVSILIQNDVDFQLQDKLVDTKGRVLYIKRDNEG